MDPSTSLYIIPNSSLHNPFPHSPRTKNQTDKGSKAVLASNRRFSVEELQDAMLNLRKAWLWDLRFRAWGFRVSGFRFRVSGFRFRV